MHRNIPGPKRKSFSVRLEWLKVVVLTLLGPELILAWAARQFFNARHLAKQFEERKAGTKFTEDREVDEAESIIE